MVFKIENDNKILVWLGGEYMVLEGCTEGKNTTQTIIDMLQQTTINKKNNKSKIERIYEDDDWIIDRVGENIRVSYFKNNHFVDEKLVTKKEFEENDLLKHGHWTLLDECSNAGVYCSVCNKKVYKTDYANQKIKSKYCPNCGSIMDEEFEKP